MVKSTAPYKVLWRPEDTDPSQPIAFDGGWMHKRDYKLRDGPGVELVMCPALAVYHHPGADPEHPRQITHKAQVMADHSIRFG